MENIQIHVLYNIDLQSSDYHETPSKKVYIHMCVYACGIIVMVFNKYAKVKYVKM